MGNVWLLLLGFVYVVWAAFIHEISMVTSYDFPNVIAALFIGGIIASTIVLISIRPGERTGIKAMIQLAVFLFLASVHYFWTDGMINPFILIVSLVLMGYGVAAWKKGK